MKCLNKGFSGLLITIFTSEIHLGVPGDRYTYQEPRLQEFLFNYARKMKHNEMGYLRVLVVAVHECTIKTCEKHFYLKLLVGSVVCFTTCKRKEIHFKFLLRNNLFSIFVFNKKKQ